MTNKHFMIFQTAVRKYVDMHEKKLKWLFFSVFFTDFKNKIRKNFGRKMRKFFKCFEFF
jgi:hypothetical protein